MAESIGGKVRNVLVGVLIGMLVLAFAVWGVNDMFTPGAQNAVATVGKTEVSTTDFDSMFRRELETINRESGSAMTNQEAYNQGLHTRVLRNMVTNTVIKIDAEDLGIGVNRRNARQAIEEIPAFTNELTGKFDENRLNQALGNARISRAQFEKDTLQSLKSQQLVPAITSGITAPADFAALQYKFLTEQRRASVLTLNTNAIDAPEMPTDEALRDYVTINAARYMAPEYRRFVMLRIEPFDYTPDITITDEQIKDAFDYQVETGVLGAPETRNIVLITASDEDTANKAADALKSGQEPILITSDLGLDSPETYDAVRKNGLIDAESSKAAFELEKGEAKAVLSGLGSWVAVYVKDITPADIPNLSEASDDIRESLLDDFAKEAIYDVTADIEDSMTEGMTLEEISEQVGVPLSAYDFIDRSGITQDGVVMNGFNAIPGVAADDVILQKLFTSDLGFETDLFETSNGGYVSLRVDDIIDTKMKPFEDIREQALSAYLNAERADALRAKALELTQRVRDGETLEAVQQSVGAGADISESILVRTNPPQTLGPQVTVGLFDAVEGDVVRGPGAVPLTEQIAVLERIVANQDGLAGTYLEVLQNQAAAAISGDIQTAYQNAVTKANPVRQYDDKIRSTLGLDQTN